MKILTPYTWIDNPAQVIYGAWRGKRRLLGIVTIAVAGAGLWFHASQHPELYGSPEHQMNNVAELTGILLLTISFASFVFSWLSPYLNRQAAKSPVIIGLDHNRLYMTGHGKLSHLAKHIEVSGDQAFSANGQLINHPGKLRAAINDALLSLKITKKPFVAIMTFDNGTPRGLSPAEHSLLSNVIQECPVLDYAVIKPDSPYFDAAQPQRVTT